MPKKVRRTKKSDAAAEFLLSQAPNDVDDIQFRPFYPHWKKLVKEGKLKERTPAKLFNAKQLKLIKPPQYVDPAQYVRDELTESTILWYPDGKLMALYLRDDVIPVSARNAALSGLEAMIFKDPTTRAETKNAIAFNGPNAKVRAGELTFGYLDRGSVRKTNPTKEQAPAFSKLEPILREMNDRYSRTTPLPFGDQNRPLAGQHTRDGGIHEEFRNFLTAFSTISVLRSCPAAVHVDRGNGQGYSVLTGVRGQDFEGGGEFCFIEYGLKISVRPGDLLLGATMREWHCNLTPVQGTKYSIICYYRRGLGSIKRRKGWAKRNAQITP